MRYVKHWCNSREESYTVIQDAVIDVFTKHAQTDPRAPESGGILLGYVRTPHLEVLEASEPTFSDRRLRFFFDRGARGHREMAERRWSQSDGLIRYIGEWHTHPEDYPTPSQVDKQGWVNLAKKRQDRRPVLAIVVGRKALHVEVVSCDGSSTILQSVPD